MPKLVNTKLIPPVGVSEDQILSVVGLQPGQSAAAITPPARTDATASTALVLTDAGGIVAMTSGSANTVTIPPNSGVEFPIGTVIMIEQLGAGSTTIDGEPGGVTLNGVFEGSIEIGQQYGAASLRKIGADEWVAQVAADLPEATEAEMRAGTETGLRAMSPELVAELASYKITSPYIQMHRFGGLNWLTSVTGSASVTNDERFLSLATGTTSGSLARGTSRVNLPTKNADTRRVDYSKKIICSGTISFGVISPSLVVRYGQKQSSGASGDLFESSFGFKITNPGTLVEIKLCAHNGTTYTESLTPFIFSLPALRGLNFILFSDGGGNLSGWFGSDLDLGSSPQLTVSGGPTTTSGTLNSNTHNFEITNTADVSGSLQIRSLTWMVL